MGNLEFLKEKVGKISSPSICHSFGIGPLIMSMSFSIVNTFKRVSLFPTIGVM